MKELKQKQILKGSPQKAVSEPAQQTNGIPNSAISEVLAGKAKPTSEMMGQRQELAPSIADKMSRSFGMDLSGMQVYRSTAMAGSDMEGIASGNKVVLSSDVDLNTTKGQAVLGHEISHIRAQSMGVGTGGRGLYDNAALEHQADTEGLMAAQGKSIYEGGTTEAPGTAYGLGSAGTAGMATLGGGLSASAGAPMQAKKGKKEAPKSGGYTPTAFELENVKNDLSGPSIHAKKNQEFWNDRYGTGYIKSGYQGFGKSIKEYMQDMADGKLQNFSSFAPKKKKESVADKLQPTYELMKFDWDTPTDYDPGDKKFKRMMADRRDDAAWDRKKYKKNRKGLL